MRKKTVCVLLAAIMLFALFPLTLSADEDGRGVFRVAVIVDSEDLEGFAEKSGTLRAFMDVLLENSDCSVTFYYDSANTRKNADFAASLIYFKVRDYRIGQYTGDIATAEEMGDYIKYVTKTAERLAITDGEVTFVLAGYSIITDFDITMSGIYSAYINENASGETTVKIILSENTISEFERLIAYARENSMTILGTNEKTA